MNLYRIRYPELHYQDYYVEAESLEDAEEKFSNGEGEPHGDMEFGEVLTSHICFENDVNGPHLVTDEVYPHVGFLKYDGIHCPDCGQPIQAGEITCEDKSVSVEIECENCGANWFEHHKFSGVSNYEAGDDEPDNDEDEQVMPCERCGEPARISDMEGTPYGSMHPDCATEQMIEDDEKGW